MKINVLWVVITLIAGFALGSWGLRSDLRKAKDELKTLQKTAEKSTKRSADLEGIRTMLRLPENKSSGAESRHERGRKHSHSNTNITGAAGITRPSTGAVVSATSTNNPHARRQLTSEEIKKASELWKTRVALARNSFVSNAQLNKDQETQFDVLVTAMNVHLADRMEQWADYLKAKGELNPEDGIRMMNDLSGVMVYSYDELDGSMPPEWRDKAGENFQLFNFIDPEVATPFTEIQEIIGNARQPSISGQNNPGKPGISVNIEKNVK